LTWQQTALTIVTQLMLFYKAVTTKNVVTEIICVVLIAALSPTIAQFVLKVGKEGFEFMKNRLAALSIRDKTS
jgi:hypothetical protein